FGTAEIEDGSGERRARYAVDHATMMLREEVGAVQMGRRPASVEVVWHQDVARRERESGNCDQAGGAAMRRVRIRLRREDVGEENGGAAHGGTERCTNEEAVCETA